MPADATWEPDLWGRVRLSVENAVSNAQASAADLENVRLERAGAAGDRLFFAGGAGHAAGGAADTIAGYERNLQLTTDRFNGGVASRSDITLAQTQLASAKAQSTELRVARAQFEHAIATLTGRPPAAVAIGHQQDRGTAAADSDSGDSVAAARAASRHRVE